MQLELRRAWNTSEPFLQLSGADEPQFRAIVVFYKVLSRIDLLLDGSKPQLKRERRLLNYF